MPGARRLRGQGNDRDGGQDRCAEERRVAGTLHRHLSRRPIRRAEAHRAGKARVRRRCLPPGGLTPPCHRLLSLAKRHGTPRRLRPDLDDPHAARRDRAPAQPARGARRTVGGARDHGRHRAADAGGGPARGAPYLPAALVFRRDRQRWRGDDRRAAPRAPLTRCTLRRERAARGDAVRAVPVRRRRRHVVRRDAAHPPVVGAARAVAAAVRTREPRCASPAPGPGRARRRDIPRDRHVLPLVRRTRARSVGDGAPVRRGTARARGDPLVEQRARRSTRGVVVSDKKSGDEGRYAYEGLDRVLHEKARLGILTSLAARADGLLFTDLKALCNLTDGNLSRHLTVLQEAGIVEIKKGFRGRRPQTLCRLTESGRRRYLGYIGVLESVLADALDAAKATRRTKRVLPEGFSPA
ncbi:MAG: transcriptional regulator [Planctomycetes bacterium]|nr:transcriptional regulator [Planctomycetota bacterium]